jgi:thermitase
MSNAPYAQLLSGLKEDRMPALYKKFNTLFLILIQVIGLTSWNFLVSPVVSAVPIDSNALVEQTVLIHFAPTATESERMAIIADMQGELVHWLPQIQVAEIRLFTNAETEQSLRKGNAADIAQSRLQAAGRTSLVTTYIENDELVEGAYLPNDPDLSNSSRSYSLQTTHTLEGWDYTRGNSSVIIAVLDSGITLNHPEFQGRLLPGYDFVNDDEDPTDDHGHGTHTAGIIAAGIDNKLGMVGVCPQCSLLPVKVLNYNNAGSWSGVAQGILFATDHGARVISLSLGAAVSSKTLEAAVTYALDHNVLLIAAAGNMGADRKFYPAALDGVLAVSATDANDQRWVLSNMGDYIDVAAPGHAVYSTYNDLQNYYGGYNYMSGTSMAAPHVAGLAGLLLSQKPERTVANLYEIITATTDPLTGADHDPYFGYGRINVAHALALGATDQTTTDAGDEQTPAVEQPQNNEQQNNDPQNNTGGEQLNRYVYMPLLFHH